jgi:hypothetical protein
MNPIVSDIVIFVETGEVPGTLEAAHTEVGPHELRKVCLKLVGWWRRRLLMASSRSCIELSPKFAWCEHLRTVVGATPELEELLHVEEHECRLHDAVSRDEMAAMNAFVRENHEPWRPGKYRKP